MNDYSIPSIVKPICPYLNSICLDCDCAVCPVPYWEDGPDGLKKYPEETFDD